MAIGNALRSLEGDREITPDEITEERLTELRLEIEACTPDQSAECISILDEAITRAQGESQVSLQSLRNNIVAAEGIESVEVQDDASYSLDALIAHNEGSEVTQNFIGLYRSQIAEDLSEIYGASYENLSPIGKSTVELIFWDIIQSSLSVRGAASIGVSRISGLTDGLRNIFQSESGDETQTQEGSIIARHVRGKIELFSNADQLSGESGTLEDLESTISLVDSLIGTQADRLNILLQETQNLGAQRAQIFENPDILRALLDTGEYEEDGFNINLNTSPVSIGLGNSNESERAQVRSTFITELQAESGNLSGSIDKIRGLANRANGIFESFGFDGGMDEFVAGLSNIPIIGFIFQMIFGNFFTRFENVENFDAVMRTIDRLRNQDPIQADAMENFHETFLPDFIQQEDNADHPLTLLHAQSPISDTFTGSLSPFFTTIAEFNEENDTNVRVDSRNFWNRIFTGEGANEYETQIFNTAQAAFGRTGFSEESLSAALNNISLSPIQEPEAEQGASSETQEFMPRPDENFIGPMPLAGVEDNDSEDEALPTSDAEVTGSGSQGGADTNLVAPDGEIAPGEGGEIAPEAGEEILSLQEQITQIQDLPATLQLDQQTSINISSFNAENSTIRIDSQEYDISVTATGINIPILSFDIRSGAGNVSLQSPTGNVIVQELTSIQLENMLTSLVEDGSYSYSGNTDDGIPFTLSVN